METYRQISRNRTQQFSQNYRNVVNDSYVLGCYRYIVIAWLAAFFHVWRYPLEYVVIQRRNRMS